jgi:hypothetical protein
MRKVFSMMLILLAITVGIVLWAATNGTSGAKIANTNPAPPLRSSNI